MQERNILDRRNLVNSFTNEMALHREDLLYNLNDTEKIKDVLKAFGETKHKGKESLQNFFYTLFNNVFPVDILASLSFCFFCIEKKTNIAEYLLEHERLCEFFRQNIWDKLEIWKWRAFYKIAVENGMFSLALYLRQNYKAALYENKENKYRWRRVQAFLEDNRYNEVKNILDCLKHDKDFMTDCNLDIQGAELLSDMVGSTPQVFHSEYYKYIDEKNVHIYGPLTIDIPRRLKDEIVIRFNEFSMRDFPDRPNIVYYNGEYYDKIHDTNMEFLRSFDHVAVKKFRGGEESYKNIRESIHLNSMLLNGTMNMVPLALFDLNLGTPEEIYVSGADLCSTSRLYGKSYIGYNRFNDIEKIIALGTHDPFTQYFMLRNLYHNKKFTADTVLTKLMINGIEEYIKAVEVNSVYPMMS